ncbi:Kinetochore_protein nuf2 [Hexamita inflata]|uniref:Kinetochore_protein nuf2 n=1 Tax=Hexamita inflata TaxID=28002 RepID=A0ABP1IZ62_9EUKA
MNQKLDSFPLIDEQTIVQILNELNINVEMSDLRQPTFEKVKYIFSGFYEYLNLEEPHKIIMKNQAEINHVFRCSTQDTHSLSLPLITFFRQMKRILNSCDVSDFRLQDLTSPSRKRLQIQISALFNYNNFMESMKQNINDNLVENKNQKNNFEFLQRSAAQKREELLNLQEEDNILEPMLAELTTNINIQISNLHMNLQNYDTAIQRITGIQNQISGLEFNNKQLDIANNKLSVSIENLRLRRYNPENLDQLKMEIARFEREISQQTKNQQDIADKINDLDTTEINLAYLYQELQNFSEQTEKLRNLTQSQKSTLEIVEQQKDANQGLKQEKMQIDQELDQNQQLFTFYKSLQQNQNNDLKNDYLQKMEDKEKLQKIIDDISNELQQHKFELENVNENLEECRKTHQFRSTKLVEQINELIKTWVVQADEMDRIMAGK